MTTKQSNKYPGKRVEQISSEFWDRQRVKSECLLCGALIAADVHPGEAAALFAKHRRVKHRNLPSVKKRDRKVTPSTYAHQRRLQPDEELAWREERRFIHTVGRT